MKRLRLHITPLLLSLAALLLAATACRDDSALTATDGPRTLTLDLGITMTRATDDGTEIGDNSRPDNLMLWIFDSTDGDANRIFYENITQGLDFALIINDQLVQTIERIINVENAPKELHFYVAMNTTDDMGLGENSTPADIEAATFTQGTWQSDNKVPMYGYAEQEISPNKSEYSFSIPLTRAVGKLELLFTKEHNGSYLKINNIKLEHIPDVGYLKNAGENETQQTASNYEDHLDNILAEETTVETSLPQTEDAELGHFSEHESNFTSLKLDHAYLLENLHGGTWANTPETALDYTYPENITEENTRYKLTVTYQTLNGGEEKTQEIYLPAIERNVWNKIFARVKGGTLQIEYKALLWQVVSTSIGYKPQHISTEEEPFDKNTAWEETDIAKGNYFVLFPQMSYNSSRKTTTQLMEYLYNHPNEGDNEARLCILTRPTYDDKIDGNDHWALKSGSAGARYLFVLTGPEGATWEAHLTNKDDFSFSTTEEDDFKDSEEYGANGGKVMKVTHGIARKKPYIIQIIANNLYTGYDKDMDGTKDIDGNGYDQYKNQKKEDWKELFTDDYLTDWGKRKWDNREVVETEFYITVKLTDGTEYELGINPSYRNNPDLKAENFPFKDKRRYAGTDTRIWIRQIRAQYDWPNLEYMARDLKSPIPDKNGKVEEYNQPYWWTVNPYWNPDHQWKD